MIGTFYTNNLMIFRNKIFVFMPQENEFQIALIDCSNFLQVTSKMQATHTPLWNEILQVPIDALPCCGTLQLEVSCNTEQILGNLDFESTFSFIVTDNLQTGFSDEWLVGTRTNRAQYSNKSKSGNLGDSSKLHISCSFDQAIVRSLQVGLWPSHEVKSPLLASPELSVSELMSKSSFVYRARQPPLPSTIGCDRGHTSAWRNVSPSRSRNRMQRGCSEYFSESNSSQRSTSPTETYISAKYL